MDKGFFDLTHLNEAADDDLLQVAVHTEEKEFAPNSNATNDVDNHVPDATVTVPGGLKETPTAKPEGGEKSVPVPGGLSEKPSNSGVSGFSNVSIPSGTTLDSATYNAIIGQLQKSFQEGADLLGQLSHVTVVEKTPQQLQEEYNDEVIGNALLEAYENGPLFEKVSRDDKDEVKEIVKKLRPKVADHLKGDKIKFYKPNLIARALTPFVPGNTVAAVDQIWTTRLWQVLGIALTEVGSTEEFSKGLTDQFKDELGDYKILVSPVTPTLVDLFRAKLGWKSTKGTFFLLVDKKLPSELKKFQKEIADGIKEKGCEGDGCQEEKKD